VNARQKGQKAMAEMVKAKKANGRIAKSEHTPKVERKGKKTAAEVKATKNGPAKAPKSCECGCGGQTKGGRFLIGHDAKLKSRLINASLGGDKKATIEIQRLGWASFLAKSLGSRDRKQAAKAKAAAEKSAL
jgi:hypothetical protein